MKHVLLLGALTLLTLTNTLAQTVNGTPVKEINVEYIQIVGTSRFLSPKITVEIDFGQENKYGTNKDTQILDSAGKRLIFNSMIDALNFMTENGYEFVQAYAFSVNGNQNVYHYLLRKRR